jgi:hypothetical protein
MLATRFAVVLLFSLSLMMVVVSTTQPGRRINSSGLVDQAPFFQDNFSGSSIDSNKWNTTFATSGMRWCSSTAANHEDAPGIWLDPSVTLCQGGGQNPPYGAVTVSGGSATFSALASETFPYIWSGSPSKSSPFPASGNFILEVKLTFNSLTGSGDGFFVNRWNNTDPIGNNPPGGHPRILLIWADITGLVVQLLGNQTYHLYDEFGTHTYVLEYVNNRYAVFVDGSLVIGPVASVVRANAIWLGNPVFTWWMPSHDWTSFSLSEVRVDVPSIQDSPSSGPVGTKVLVQGTGIPTSAMKITFDDMFVGTAPVSNGSFNFTMDVPQAQLGSHEIKAVDELSNIIATAQFVVSPNGPSAVALTLTVGTVYFPGDTVITNLLVTLNGVPLSSSSLQVQLNLAKPDNSNIALNVTSEGSGLFKASYSLPKTAQIGTYSLIAIASAPTLGSGSALASFEVKLPWLSSQTSTGIIAGVASLATVSVALVSWRKGYFKRSSKDPF